MLMALGIGKRDVYEDDFENPFLKESREFYMVTDNLMHYVIYLYTYVHTCTILVVTCMYMCTYTHSMYLFYHYKLTYDVRILKRMQ